MLFEERLLYYSAALRNLAEQEAKVSIALHCSILFLCPIIVPLLYTKCETSIVITSNPFIILHSSFAVVLVLHLSRLLGLSAFLLICLTAADADPTSPSHPNSNFFTSAAPHLSSILFTLTRATFISYLHCGSWHIVGGVINTLQPAPQSSKGRSTPASVEDSHELDHFDLKASPSVRIASTLLNVD